MTKLKVLDLFSGIGGFSLGLERTGGFETVAFCEYDEWLNQRLKNWHPDIPAFRDARNITGEYDGSVDVITGGDPCQPSSTAGKRKGKEDDRYLWPAMSAAIKKFRPTWVIRENVRGNISNGILDTVELDLESAGYACRTYLLPAYAVGAWHERFRTWTVAYSESARERREIRNVREAHGRQGGALLQQLDSTSQDVPNRSGERLSLRDEVGNGGQARGGKQQGRQSFGIHSARGPKQWPIEPAVGRVANGIPRRVDRLRALGNAVVPQIPEIIGHAILQAEGA